MPWKTKDMDVGFLALRELAFVWWVYFTAVSVSQVA
jgi:hypothetical protein